MPQPLSSMRADTQQALKQRAVASDCCAVHNAALVRIIRPAPVQHLAVVPDHQIARLPLVAVDMLRAHRKTGQLPDQGPALFDRPANHMGAMAPHIIDLAARGRVGAHQGLARRRERALFFFGEDVSGDQRA